MKQMKSKSILFLTAIVFLLSGCLVYSFYPLYTEKDLFANDLLLGEWIDGDSSIWKFEHKPIGKKELGKVDSTAYILKIKEEGHPDFTNAAFIVRIVKLEETYFLDFYLQDYKYDDEADIFDLHLIPVHTFAKMELKGDHVRLNWFDPGWLGDLIEKNKIRIHHENNDEHILLTAKPEELQKFVVKYVNSNEAFKDGLDVEMKRIK